MILFFIIVNRYIRHVFTGGCLSCYCENFAYIAYTVPSLRHSSCQIAPLSEFSLRCLKSIGISKFTRDILSCRLITHPRTDLSDLVDSWAYTIRRFLHFLTNMLHSSPKVFEVNLRILGLHAPALSKLKAARRHLERIWFTRVVHLMFI